MADRARKGLEVLMDVSRYLPTVTDVLRPLPSPKHGEMVMQGITADVLSWAVGHIPTVGDLIGNFINDNIMADVLVKLSPEQRAEFREQNRVYPNGIALVRAFQRTPVAPGGAR